MITERMTTKATSRFNSKIEVNPDGCWVWTSSKDGRGYGAFSLYGRSRGPEKAHRISFAMQFGELGMSGMEVCHSCDNPSCVRPDHLFLGTHHDNMLDAKNKRRLRVKSKGRPGSKNNSAKLVEEQIPIIRLALLSGESLTSIGRRFGVDRAIVARIRDGKLWRSW